METSKLDFDLPEKLIARHPISPRDAAKLMVLGRKTKRISEDIFQNLGHYLRPGDVLVLNKTKVFPARTYAKTERGRQVEVVFLKEVTANAWEVLIGGRTKDQESLHFGHGLSGWVRKNDDGLFVTVNLDQVSLFRWLEKIR